MVCFPLLPCHFMWHVSAPCYHDLLPWHEFGWCFPVVTITCYPDMLGWHDTVTWYLDILLAGVFSAVTMTYYHEILQWYVTMTWYSDKHLTGVFLAVSMTCYCDMFQWHGIMKCYHEMLQWYVIVVCNRDMVFWYTLIGCVPGLYHDIISVTCYGDMLPSHTLGWFVPVSCDNNFCNKLSWHALSWCRHSKRHKSCTNEQKI